MTPRKKGESVGRERERLAEKLEFMAKYLGPRDRFPAVNHLRRAAALLREPGRKVRIPRKPLRPVCYAERPWYAGGWQDAIAAVKTLNGEKPRKGRS